MSGDEKKIIDLTLDDDYDSVIDDDSFLNRSSSADTIHMPVDSSFVGRLKRCNAALQRQDAKKRLKTLSSKPCKSWVYTCNNFTDFNVSQLKAITAVRHRCCVEKGESGTPHLQGFITFKRAYRFTQLVKLFGERFHWEMAKAKDAENYCTKGDIIIDFGFEKKQGFRSDIAEIIASASLREAALSHPETFIRYPSGIAKYFFYKREKEIELEPDFDTEYRVHVFWGEPGTGKSRTARSKAGRSLYVVPPPAANGMLWWDGYMGERSILLDDFRASWMKLSDLLNLLDGYRQRLQNKGGTTHKGWRTVYITTNTHPKNWYPKVEQIHKNALGRRLTSVTEFKFDTAKAEEDYWPEDDVEYV